MAIGIGLLVGEFVPATGFGDWAGVWRNCLDFAFEDIAARDGIDQPIEIAVRQVEGLPTGGQHAVVKAWRELEAEGVLAIMGPSNADNGRAVRDTANAGEVSTFLFGCSEQLASPWTFGMPWGAAPEDALLAASWLHRQGHRRIGVLWDTAWHGEEWMHYARIGARRFGLEIVGEARIPALVLDAAARARQGQAARAGVARLRALGPDALLMMTSHGSLPFIEAVADAGWDVPRVVAGGSFAPAARLLPGRMQGWVGTSLFDERNPRAVRLFRRYRERHGEPPPELEDMIIAVHDGARALLEGISLAPIMTRAGVRRGIEQVKHLPATSGAPTSIISFSEHDHRGFKGPAISVLRRQAGPTRADFVFEGEYTQPRE